MQLFLLWSKAEFSASLLQSLVSHDPSEIILICWFAAQETLIITIIIYVEYNIHYTCIYCYFDQFNAHLLLINPIDHNILNISLCGVYVMCSWMFQPQYMVIFHGN